MMHESFSDLYQRQPEVASKAHGRVNLIGEHTDYNGGFVLPMSIPQAAVAYLAKRADKKVRVSSSTVTADSRFEFELTNEKKRGDWTDYIQGVTWILAKAGFNISGFDMLIDSTVPMGSGLSSSAALEVAVIRALAQAFELTLTPVEMAKLGQRVENEFVGAQVGIMDQMAASLCQDGSALFIDTRNLKSEQVSLPESFSLVVINSGVSHSHAGGDYNRRRQECEEACALLKVEQLRDLNALDLQKLEALPQVLGRRARHVITENDRVISALEALKNGDMNILGQLFVESHISMRDDYEVSCREIDLLIESALSESGVFGARMTGGGFGGSIIALVQKEKQQVIADNIVRTYHEKTGRQGSILLPRQESEIRQ